MFIRYLSIIAVLFLLSGKAFAIPQKADLLLKLSQNSKPDTNQLKTLHDIGNYYLNKKHEDKKADLDSAMLYFFKAYKLNDVVKTPSSHDKYETLCKLGEVYAVANNLKESRACFMQAAKFYHDNGYLEKEAYTNRRYVIYSWPNSYAFRDMEMLLLKSLDIYKKLNRPDDIVLTGYWVALVDLHLDSSNGYALSESRCWQIIEQYQHANTRYLDRVYNLLSRTNRYKGNLNKSLSYSLKSVNLMQMTGDTVAAEQMYGELAQTYQDLDQTEKSIYYYKKTIELREKKNLPQEYIFRTAGFVVQGLIKLNKPAEALHYIEEIERRNKPDDKTKFAFIEQSKGYCYEALKDYKKAEDAYLGMIRDFQQQDDEVWFLAQYDIARFYIKQKRYANASQYLDVSSMPPNFSKVKDLEYLYFQIDSAQGKLLAAIQHFRNYKAMNDSVFNVAKNKQIQELQIKYETDQKEKDIRILKKDSLLQQNKVQRANVQRNLTLAGIIILALLIVAFYRSYSANRQKNIVLNQLIADKDCLLLEKDNLLIEKEWLMKEIHHRVKNNLQIVMGLLQRQSAYIDSEAALSAIQNSENRMHSIALIHQKLYQADSLDLIYMPDYIDEFTGYLKDTSDLGNRLLFEKQFDEIYLNVSQAVPIGLILNEAITNAIKYAYAIDETGIILVLLRKLENEQYLLSVKDNGVGLGKDFALDKIDSMGMNLMRGLAKQLGGKFNLENNGGVTISVTFKIMPLHDHKS